MEWNISPCKRNPITGPGSFLLEKFSHGCGLYLHSLFLMKAEYGVSIFTLQKSFCFVVAGFLQHARVVKNVTCVSASPKWLTTGPYFWDFIFLYSMKCEEGSSFAFLSIWSQVFVVGLLENPLIRHKRCDAVADKAGSYFFPNYFWCLNWNKFQGLNNIENGILKRKRAKLDKCLIWVRSIGVFFVPCFPCWKYKNFLCSYINKKIF